MAGDISTPRFMQTPGRDNSMSPLIQNTARDNSISGCTRKEGRKEGWEEELSLIHI